MAGVYTQRHTLFLTQEVAWDQAPQWGKKAKNGVKQEKNGNRREPSGTRHPFPSPDYLSTRFARRFCFFRQSRFFLLFPTCGAWSQATQEGKLLTNQALPWTVLGSNLPRDVLSPLDAPSLTSFFSLLFIVKLTRWKHLNK